MTDGAFGDRVLDGRQVHLRVLATSDLHMHLMPFDYARNRPSAQVGLARTAGLVAAARAEARNVLLVDNGDFLQGNPLADMAARDAGPNPAIVAMNGLGYDAAALGNHEFDYGLPVLERALAAARFPVLAANAVVPGPGGEATLTAPWTILRREVRDLSGRPAVLNIGMIGLLPPQVAVWSRDHVAGRVAFRGIVETAAAMVPQMRAAGADIVVALAHTGIGAAEGGADMENAALPLARVPGIDALVLGHSHLVFPSARFERVPGVDAAAGLVGGKPAVMPGAFGSHLGVIDLLVQPEADGWRVAASSVAARPVAELRGGRVVARVRPDAAVVRLAEASHGRARAAVARTVGRSAQRLTTHFALVADSAAVRLVAEAKAAFVRAALGEAVPVLGSAAPFRTGGRMGPQGYSDIPAGRLAARHLAELYPFPNLLRAVRLNGRQVRRWLEQGAALFNTVAPGDRDVPLLSAEVPGYAFDLIGGLTFDIRVDRPVGQRIADLRHGGEPVAEEAEFVVASSSYRVAAMVPEAVPVLAGDVPVREVLERHVAAGGAARIGAAPGWRLRLPAGASVLFPTAPHARVPAGGLGGLAASDLGIGADGFRLVRLTAGEG